MRPTPSRSTLAARSVLGIPVGIHWTALLPGVLIASGISGGLIPATTDGVPAALALLIGIAGAVAFGAAILAHEFGHALVARQRGIGVHDINLFALGGIARLERDPDNPRDALHVAAAGPAVSAALAIVGLGAAGVASVMGFSLAATLFVWFALVNAIMVVFNLIPAAPLDGGRILQAYLWKRRDDRWSATITAAKAGRLFGWLLAGIGLVQLTGGSLNGLWPVMVGWFIVRSARAERRHARFQQKLATRRRAAESGSFGDQLIADLLARHTTAPGSAGAASTRQPPLAGRTVIDV